jgi:hypothetical protein
MNRNEFVKAMAATVPVAAVAPDFSRFAETEIGKVKITDVKVMRVKIGSGHAMPLVKIETDAGVYGIGECHHDVTGLGAKDVVLNAFKQILVNKDPFRYRKTDRINEMARVVSWWKRRYCNSCCYRLRNSTMGSSWKTAGDASQKNTRRRVLYRSCKGILDKSAQEHA